MAWHHDQKRQERLSERPERRCVVCDGLIDPSRPDGTILCSPACMQKRKYAAIKANPERLERHRERSRTAQYRAYHTRKPHEVARDSLQKRWQDGADRVLEANLGGVVEEFDVLGIFVRDNWTCQVCGGRVEVGLTGREPLSASLDHVVAILKGGDHSPENLQTTHFVCNTTAKQDRPLERARQVATRRDGDVTVRGLHEIASYVADEHPLGHVMDG